MLASTQQLETEAAWESTDSEVVEGLLGLPLPALQLLHGHDPYQSVTLSGADAALGQATQYATPLRRGSFADRSWLDYPTAAEISAALATQLSPCRPR